MKHIKLTQGKRTIVDDGDFDWLNQYRWCFSQGYACRGIYDAKTQKTHIIQMQRFIMNTPKGMETDHKNRNTLDNRRENLRLCNKIQNQGNRTATAISGYKGVYWHQKMKKWEASFCKNYKKIYIGLFEKKEDAAKAYNKAALEYYGEFARLNEFN